MAIKVLFPQIPEQQKQGDLMGALNSQIDLLGEQVRDLQFQARTDSLNMGGQQFEGVVKGRTLDSPAQRYETMRPPRVKRVLRPLTTRGGKTFYSIEER